MEQYISKSALLAEIERLHKAHSGKYGSDEVGVNLEYLEDFLDTLEVKEVDYKPIDKDFERDAVQFCFDNGLNTTPRIAKTIAKHFFELGLKAQIMTSKLQQRISVLKMEFWTGLQTFNESEMTLSDAYNQGVDDILEELGLKAQKGE